MCEFSSKLLAPDGSNLMGEDKQLCKLAAECRALSDELVGLLEKIKAKDPKSKIQSLCSAFKDRIYEKEKLDLEQRLNSCRSQFELQVSFLMR
jgi:hypothetical protein